MTPNQRKILDKACQLLTTQASRVRNTVKNGGNDEEIDAEVEQLRDMANEMLMSFRHAKSIEALKVQE